MSKRYSGKSFKDSSVSKKPKLSLKEKSLILKKVRRNSKIEAGLNLLSLKNIEEIDTN